MVTDAGFDPYSTVKPNNKGCKNKKGVVFMGFGGCGSGGRGGFFIIFIIIILLLFFFIDEESGSI